jgi:F-type H+-transporting ATPase subunit delta
MNDLLAKRYAKALLAIGIEDGRPRELGRELDEFSRSLTAAGDDARALTSPMHPREARGRALEAVLTAAGLTPRADDFLRLLHDRGRLDRLPAMVAAYRALLDEDEGLVRGSLTSASPLSEGEAAAVKAALSTFIGRKVELTVVEDQSVIGGLVARLGDLVVDASLRSQLERLGRELTA